MRYKIGDAFVSLPLSDVSPRLEKEQEVLSSELSALKDEMESSAGEMETLKSALYGKFGKAINLEA